MNLILNMIVIDFRTILDFIHWKIDKKYQGWSIWGETIWFLNQFHSRPDRLRAIADRFNLDQNAVLDNVLYARAYTSKTNYSESQNY